MTCVISPGREMDIINGEVSFYESESALIYNFILLGFHFLSDYRRNHLIEPWAHVLQVALCDTACEE